MISVTKPGKPVQIYSYICKCSRCGCEAKAQQEDIKADDRPCSQPYVDCPCCGGRMEVKLNV